MEPRLTSTFTPPRPVCSFDIFKTLKLKICLRLHENEDVFRLSSAVGAERPYENKYEDKYRGGKNAKAYISDASLKRFHAEDTH